MTFKQFEVFLLKYGLEDEWNEGGRCFINFKLPQERTSAEVAEILDVSPSYVTSVITKVKNQMRVHHKERMLAVEKKSSKSSKAKYLEDIIERERKKNFKEDEEDGFRVTFQFKQSEAVSLGPDLFRLEMKKKRPVSMKGPRLTTLELMGMKV